MENIVQVEDNIDVHTLCPDSSRRQKLFTGGSLEEKEGNPPLKKMQVVEVCRAGAAPSDIECS